MLFSCVPLFNNICCDFFEKMKYPIFLVFVCCLALQTLAKKVSKKNENKHNFLIGRIPPGYFEYPVLNGYFSPKEAAKVCEADTACGGFTFKGVVNSPKKVFEVYFFHYVPKELFNISNANDQSFHWTSYIVKSRNFIELKNHKIQSLPVEEPRLCLKDR